MLGASAGSCLGRDVSKVADAKQVRRGVHGNDRHIGTQVDAADHLERVAHLDQPEELGRLAVQDGAARPGPIVDDEAICGQRRNQSADTDALPDPGGQAMEIDDRDGVRSLGGLAGARATA